MAEPFTTLTSLPMPLIRDNIDTDQIIPSREMKSTGKTGLAVGLFAGWRYTEIGGRELDRKFIMNDPEYKPFIDLLIDRVYTIDIGESKEVEGDAPSDDAPEELKDL